VSETLNLKIQELRTKAEAVHVAALNLSNTFGVFHGINNAVERGTLMGSEIRAINIIQSDLLHLLVIRVCALCFTNQKERPDDASLDRLISALRERELCGELIAADKRWRAAVGPRAERCATVQKSIGMLRRRWAYVNSQPEVWKRLNHFRSKRLGHITVAAKPRQEAQLNELWSMTRNALSAARQVRLVFCREDTNYLQLSARAEVVGRRLIVVIEPKSLQNTKA
jgi:hypothetical protein